MPYFVLYGSVPDTSHLKVFGCGAYVHIPKDVCINVLSPKSELMEYLGHTDSIKASVFMHLSNNTVFTSTTALFDETLYPKCPNARIVTVPRDHGVEPESYVPDSRALRSLAHSSHPS